MMICKSVSDEKCQHGGRGGQELRNSELRIRNLELRIDLTNFQIPNAKFRIRFLRVLCVLLRKWISWYAASTAHEFCHEVTKATKKTYPFSSS